MRQHYRRNHWSYCIISLILLVYLTGFFSHAWYLQKTVYGDGVYYYSWLRSIIIDHDLNFANEYAAFGSTQLINKYAVGPAALWLPTFLTVHNLTGGNGLTLPYQLAIGLTNVFFTLIGLLLLWRLLGRFFTRYVSLLTILAVALATNLLFYGSLDPVNSHGLSFFAAVFFLSSALGPKKNWWLLGGSLGLLAITRPQDVVYGLVLLPAVKSKTWLPLALGFLLVFSVQLLAWQAVSGRFWQSPYFLQGEGFDFLKPHLWEILFSPQNGLFFWTPITILGAIGLIKFRLLFIIFVAEIFLVASWSTWWQGASFSGRMLVSSLPVLAFGLAQIFSRLKKFSLILILPLIVLNFFLTAYFLLIT